MHLRPLRAHARELRHRQPRRPIQFRGYRPAPSDRGRHTGDVFIGIVKNLMAQAMTCRARLRRVMPNFSRT
jgi:hypothetical protein